MRMKKIQPQITIENQPSSCLGTVFFQYGLEFSPQLLVVEHGWSRWVGR